MNDKAHKMMEMQKQVYGGRKDKEYTPKALKTLLVELNKKVFEFVDHFLLFFLWMSKK